VQKGVREELLCEECEGLLSEHENHWKQVFFGSEAVKIERVGNKFIGLDYAKMKLFQLSILWRAGISSNFFFGKVNLGQHEERLRRMILEGRPGRAWEYPCLMSVLLHENEVVSGCIVQPMRIRFAGHTCYRFVFGGLLWVHFASSHAPLSEVMEWVLQEDGTLKMHVDEFQNLRFIREIASKLKNAGKLPSQQRKAS
jgi:hypothetical protein